MTARRSLPAIFAAFIAAGLLAAACSGPRTTIDRGPDPPRLVVFVVVDQLRADLPLRYMSAFDGGLLRLYEQGRVFRNAAFTHATTETSPGHAALSTGTQPARAGISANAWREIHDGERRQVYNVVDASERLVGFEELPGASPRVLRRTGLADWIRRVDSDARVLSFSGKDRAAVLMAGQARGDVVWFSGQAGRFVTSTWYTDENPAWLDRYNTSRLPAYRADSVWQSVVPADLRGLSAPDTADFEYDGVHTHFPHRYGEEGTGDFYRWFEGTPMLDAATLEIARDAVVATGAGQTPGRTDYLSVSLSQTDRIGHAFGPLSREQMDNLIRLDRELGAFLTFLDERIGHDNYVLGFSADHGVLTMPERLDPPGRRLSEADRIELQNRLNAAAQAALADGEKPASTLIDAFALLDFAGPARTHEMLRELSVTDSITAYFRNSFVQDRGAGLLSPYEVETTWARNVLSWSLPRGTTHGSPYRYDRWVPVVLMGRGVVAAQVSTPVQPVDIAPTLARLAGILTPGDLDGMPLPTR